MADIPTRDTQTGGSGCVGWFPISIPKSIYIALCMAILTFATEDLKAVEFVGAEVDLQGVSEASAISHWQPARDIAIGYIYIMYLEHEEHGKKVWTFQGSGVLQAYGRCQVISLFNSSD